MTERVSDEELNKLCGILDKLHGIGFDFADGETCLANMISLNLRDARATIAALRRQLAESADALHYANGVADLAMKHRDLAEAVLAAAKTAAWVEGRNAAAREIEQNFGPETDDGEIGGEMIRALQPSYPSPAEAAAESGSEMRL